MDAAAACASDDENTAGMQPCRTHWTGDASHLMQSMSKALRAQNDDMHFASPLAGPGQYSLEKTQPQLVTSALSSTGLTRHEMSAAHWCKTLQRLVTPPSAGCVDRQFRSNMRIGLSRQAIDPLWRALPVSVSCAHYRIH